MLRKCYIIILTIFCLMLILNFSVVKATEEVTDREMAIAAAMSYVPVKEGKTMSECFDLNGNKTISKVVNYVNGKFNLHDYATLEELDDWIVDEYKLTRELTQCGLNIFRLKKDNNLMIVVTGTNSLVDAFEDIRYGVRNATIQEIYMKKYLSEALNEYSKKNEKYNIYITGHSLGGYLAQVGGAYIEDTINSNNKYKNLKLARIVDFNGMGINYLTALGKNHNYGNKNNIIETLKAIGEDGRLIEYYTYGDIVSSLGVHYGEMRELTPSIDSIAYHRWNYRALGSFGSKLFKIAEADTFMNGCKTDLSNAQSFYKVGNIAAFLNLTHEADTFVTINENESINQPVVKVTEKTATIANFFDGVNKNIYKTSFTISSTKKIRAVTAYASAKKYEWYVKENGNWKLIKTSTIDKNDSTYNPNEKVTNELELKISNFKYGEEKEYMVKSYYNDNYISSKYYINEKDQYGYKEDEEKSKQEESKVVTTTFTVKRNALKIFTKFFR